MLSRAAKPMSNMRSFLLGCALASIFCAPAHASENRAVNSDTASQKLKLILQDAERRGVLSGSDGGMGGSVKGGQAISSPIAIAALPPTCDATQILDFSDLKDVEAYEKAATASSNDSETIANARTMIGLGMGLEAHNILKSIKTPEANLLREATLILDRHAPEAISTTTGLKSTKVCDTASLIWAILATPAVDLEILGAEDVRAILQTLREFPPHLREIISLRLGISTAEAGQIAVARQLWLSLSDFARQYDRPAPEEITSDYSYLYLKGLLAETDTPGKALAIYTYILQRDTLYRPAAIRRAQAIYQQSSRNLPEEIKAELIALGHQYSGQLESRQANRDLIIYQARSGQLDQAIVAARSKFSPYDTEYKQLVNLIAEKLDGKLTATPLPTRMSGLNSYLSDPIFFETAKHVNTIKHNALRTAMDADLPELWTHIYAIDPTDNDALALLVEARLLLGIKTGNMRNVVAPKTETTIAHKIDYHIRNSELESAKRLLSALPDGRRKTDYEMQIAWLEGRWNTVGAYSDQSKSETEHSAGSQNRNLKSEAQNLAKLLAKTDTENSSKRTISTIEDAEEILTQIRDELKIAREYIDNG